MRNSQNVILLKQSYYKTNKDFEEMRPQRKYIDGKQAYETMLTDQQENANCIAHRVHWFFNQSAKAIQWGKDSLYSKCCWNNCMCI